MKNLGIANGWKDEPEEYKACREQKHEVKSFSSSSWSCYTYYCCEKCQIKWEVDSSG